MHPGPWNWNEAIRAAWRSVLVGAALVLLSSGVASALMITEVVFDPVPFGSDFGSEFVEIYNDGASTIDLADYSLGWGAAAYTEGTLDLDAYGTIDPGEVIVIGGPTDLLGYDFAPELSNGFLVAAGVALFDVESGSIGGSTPIDAVIYGTFFVFGNLNGLIDETGGVGAVDAVTADSTQSVARDILGVWGASPTPDPGTVPFAVPEPSTFVLVGLGLLWMSYCGRTKRSNSPRRA